LSSSSGKNLVRVHSGQKGQEAKASGTFEHPERVALVEYQTIFPSAPKSWQAKTGNGQAPDVLRCVSIGQTGREILVPNRGRRACTVGPYTADCYMHKQQNNPSCPRAWNWEQSPNVKSTLLLSDVLHYGHTGTFRTHGGDIHFNRISPAVSKIFGRPGSFHNGGGVVNKGFKNFSNQIGTVEHIPFPPKDDITGGPAGETKWSHQSRHLTSERGLPTLKRKDPEQIHHSPLQGGAYKTGVSTQEGSGANETGDTK